MRIVFDKNRESEQVFDQEIVIIQVSEDVEFRICVNQFNELVINKINFGSDSGSISIEPHTSNQIAIK